MAKKNSGKNTRKNGKRINNNLLIAGIVGTVLLLAAIFILPGLFQAKEVVGEKSSLPLEITVSKAADMRNAGAFMLDVRTREEWNAGHIPDAVLIPLDELPNRLAEVPQDQQIVVVCRSGNRSASGRDILLTAGYSQVTSMAGGMNDWSASGLPLVTGP